MNQDNSSVEIETLREATILDTPQIVQHNLSAKQVAILDLKTAYHSIKCNSNLCMINKPLPFGLKRFKNLTAPH